jgi:hypothetical protein
MIAGKARSLMVPTAEKLFVWNRGGRLMPVIVIAGY